MGLFIKLLRLRRHGYEDIAANCVQNIDVDEEISITCTGYERNRKQKFLLYFFWVVLVGVPYLLLKWYPQFEAYYFWKKCTLDKAQIVLVKESADKCTLHRIVELPKQSASDLPVRYFMYKLHKFMWNKERSHFQVIRGLADGVNTFADILDYKNGLTHHEKQLRMEIHDKNYINIEIKSYWRLLVDEALNPFYIFEMFSITVWIFDEYYYYAFFIIIVTIFSLEVALSQTRKHSQMVKNLATSDPNEKVIIHTRNGEKCESKAELLVPGDVIEIPSHGCTMMCDALLISGTCIVNESSLTGESSPVTKIIPISSNEVYKPNSLHMRYTLFCGTKILQTRFYEDNSVLAVVTETGSNTAKGQLVRSILYPKRMDFDFMLKSMRFLFLLVLVATIAMIYSAYLYIKREASIMTLLLRTFDIVTIVVPPSLPTAMNAGMFHSQKRLKKRGIFAISQSRILLSGETTVVCFDKTGTLTEEGMDFWGMLPAVNNNNKTSQPPPLNDNDIINNINALDDKSLIKTALAVCHSLTVIGDKICGDPLDIAMFKATDWFLEEPGKDTAKFDMLAPTIVYPKDKVQEKIADENEDDDLKIPYQVGIIRQFPFTSEFLSMTVICRTLGSRNMTVFSKGAPEKILRLCDPTTVPENINCSLKQYTAAGYRVIALAYRQMRTTFNWVHANKITREQTETDLEFIGLLLMQNNLKSQSEQVITQLTKANIKSIMLTGDNIMTAVSVSRDCGILPQDCHVVLLIVDTSGATPMIHLESLSGIDGNKIDVRDPLVRFVTDGNSWYLIKIHFPTLLDFVAVKTCVFARMSPQQKTQIVETLQKLDHYVTMCGDGANDCAALKAAHVGVSLTGTEASIVAPFTSRNADVTCVLDLIKEGRCALVTSFGLFNYMAMYSLIQFISVIILYSLGMDVGTMQFLYVDLILTTSLVMTMGKTGPSDTLIMQPPITSLVSLGNVIPLLLQIVTALMFQLLALVLLRRQSWYVPVAPGTGDDEVVQCWENTSIYTVSCFQYLILAFLYSRGQRHRQSFYKNWLMMAIFVILTAFTIVLTLFPTAALSKFFELKEWTPIDAFFRFYLVLLPIAHFGISFIIELMFNEKMELMTNFHKSLRNDRKKKYQIIEEQEKSGVNWCSV